MGLMAVMSVILLSLFLFVVDGLVDVIKENCNEIKYYDQIPDGMLASDLGKLVFLDAAASNNGAACLDGTVPGIYYRDGFDDGLNKFSVFFQGGGWCTGITDQLSPCQDTCVDRAGGNLGSSSNLKEYSDYNQGYLSTDSTVNPVAFNWNTIWVNYCDGASYSGNNDTILHSNGYRLHFRGFRNLNGVFELLINEYNFADTTDVIISGCSAGGLNIYMHADHIYQTFVPKSANFMAILDSGFFLKYEGAGKYITAMQWVYEYQNLSGSINTKCIDYYKQNNLDPNECMFAQNISPFMEVKTLALQSVFDSWQIGCELMAGANQISLINDYGNNLKTIFINNYIKANGSNEIAQKHNAFTDSCSHHCSGGTEDGQWDGIIINNKSSGDAEQESYNGDKQVFLFQDEKYPCNDCCANSM